jgi:uncharacterized membrane protein YesL
MEAFLWKLHGWGEWLGRMVLVNVLWLLFTLMGGVIFGLFPATAAMFAVVGRWQAGEAEVPVLRTFWETYRNGFGSSLLIGYALVIVGMVLAADLMFFTWGETVLHHVIAALMVGACLVYASVLCFVFPVHARFRLPWYRCVKSAVVIGAATLPHGLLTFAGCAAIAGVLFALPVLLLLIGGSLSACWMSWRAGRVFMRIEKRIAQKEKNYAV